MTIKELREKAGMTQKEAYTKLDIPRRTFQDWESGKRIPPSYVEKLVKDYLMREAISGSMMAYIEENLEWQPISDEDYFAIAEAVDNEIDMNVDEMGRVWNEGGQYIADIKVE